MDAAELAALQADLVAWGALGADGQPTRRARAALARAAARLRDDEAAGRPPPAGHPLVAAASLALAELAPAGGSTPGHAKVLAAVELAGLPDSVQRLLSGS